MSQHQLKFLWVTVLVVWILLQLQASAEVNNVAGGNFYPTEATIVDNDCSSSRKGHDPNFDNQSCVSAEIPGELSFETKSSGNLECEDSIVGKIVGEITLSSAVPSMENHSNTPFNDSDLDN